jgi:exopolysaccharide biosynthesis glucuronosyltransferase PssD
MKTLAIASAGGHWVQLLRLMPALADGETIFVSTKASFAETVPGREFYNVPDANRWNKFKLVWMALKVARIVIFNRPKLIITTGAAPGIMGILAGRMIGSRTIWIDSIANVEKLSMSGRIAVLFAHKVYTQWPHLAGGNVIYKGNVIQ